MLSGYNAKTLLSPKTKVMTCCLFLCTHMKHNVLAKDISFSFKSPATLFILFLIFDLFSFEKSHIKDNSKLPILAIGSFFFIMSFTRRTAHFFDRPNSRDIVHIILGKLLLNYSYKKSDFVLTVYIQIAKM